MNIESSATPAAGRATRETVTLSPWVNEPLPDIQAILCSRDLEGEVRTWLQKRIELSRA